jgi:hypothetical protein
LISSSLNWQVFECVALKFAGKEGLKEVTGEKPPDPQAKARKETPASGIASFGPTGTWLSRRRPVRCARSRAFPEGDLGDGHSGRFGVLEDQPGDVFGRGIFRDQNERLTQRFEDGRGGIVFAEDHAVIQLGIDPHTKLAFDVREIDQHAPVIERFGFEHDHGFAVVAVQVPTLPRVVEEPVAVAKIDLL